jgi:uncharacterized protein (DUF1697 family)
MAEMPVTRHVALLRGVNVGGVTVKNAQLVEAFEREGFTSVRTVLASGNIVFDAVATAPQEDLGGRIRAALARDIGREIPLVLETQERLREVAAGYPFEREDAALHPYVVFSSDPTALGAILEAAIALVSDVESVQEGDRVVYWRVPRGSTLETPFAKVLAGRQVARRLTTRNLRTVEKLTNA